MGEQPKNGQVDQQIRRRPAVTDVHPRPTVERFPRRREDFGAAGADPAGFDDLTQAPHGRPDGRRRTATPTALEEQPHETTAWNQPNRSRNGVDNDATTGATDRGERERLRTGWELPELIRPLPRRRRVCAAKPPRLLPHQPALVEYIYLSRFATASQVQRRFSTLLRSARTTQWQLANLVKLGLLATAPVRSTSPNFPYVYFATGKGVKLINDTYARHGLSKRHPPGEGQNSRGVALESILHEVLLTELELAIRNTIELRHDLALLTTERRYFRSDLQLKFSAQGKQHRVIPDGGFLIRRGESVEGSSRNARFTTQLNFIELDNGTMSPGRLLQKLEQYATWNQSDTGERYLQNAFQKFRSAIPQARFRLLLVVHDKIHPDGDERRLAALFEQVLKLAPSMRDRVWLATADDLKRYQHHSPPLSASIWYRGRDAKHWIPQLPRGDRRQVKALRQFVIDHLPSLPRHPLFPHIEDSSGLHFPPPPSCTD